VNQQKMTEQLESSLFQVMAFLAYILGFFALVAVVGQHADKDATASFSFYILAIIPIVYAFLVTFNAVKGGDGE